MHIIIIIIIQRLSAIIQPPESIQWEPEEAIVVSYIVNMAIINLFSKTTQTKHWYSSVNISLLIYRFYWITVVQ